MASAAVSFSRFDFSKSQGQALVIHSVRLAFLVLVFFITLTFQFMETRVEAAGFFYPLYSLILISFVLQATFFALFSALYKNVYVNALLFAFETFYVTGLIYFIGIQQSLLIFLYLVNLMLCGVYFQRRGALTLALWTSVLFSFIISLDTSISGNMAYLAVGVNNLAFFTVAYLSGFLSEQLNIMGAQLKERTRDIRTLKNLNDLILSSMSSGLITVDQQGQILQANPAAMQILGRSEDATIGLSIEGLLPGVDWRSDSGREMDHPLKRQGEKRILRVLVNTLKNEVGREQGRVISFRDETQVRALETRVRQSEKMAAIGQLAAGIAHEIRNPLAGISGSIQLMEADASDREQNLKLMGIVTKEIDRLNNLITEFLDFAKPEAPMEDRVDLGDLAREAAQVISLDREGTSIDLRLEVEEGLLMLGNRDKIKQALLNIIVNAKHAVENSDSPQVTVSVKRLGSQLQLSVKDNGIGMSPELKQTIFEPFKTTKAKGTGLGLAITHSIIEAHRGSIVVDSEPGEGTEFRMQFQSIPRS